MGDRSDRIQFIKKYFKESMKSHGPYAMKFFFCEFLCLVNVIGQMYFTDRFLGYTFMTYGSDVFAMTFGDPEGRSDPMDMVFPKVVLVMLVMLMISMLVLVVLIRIIDHPLSGDEVHVPQVRTFRNCDKTRRTLHPRSQHHQREDLRVPLVLVCGGGHHVWSCHHLQNGRHSRSFPQGFCHLRACSQPGPAINSKGAHYQQVRLARSGWRLLGDLLVVQEPQPHRNEGAFGGTQAGHGSSFKQLPTSLSFNGNGREGVQHVDEEKRERRKRGVKEESLRRRRHFRESEPLWRGRTCCEIFFLQTTDD